MLSCGSMGAEAIAVDHLRRIRTCAPHLKEGGVASGSDRQLTKENWIQRRAVNVTLRYVLGAKDREPRQ